jgi:uncharacterized membrane protein AbrB (regulator of aidB expression)
MKGRVVPLAVLAASLVAAALLSRGMGAPETTGMLACGVLAGGALASIARRR